MVGKIVVVICASACVCVWGGAIICQNCSQDCLWKGCWRCHMGEGCGAFSSFWVLYFICTSPGWPTGSAVNPILVGVYGSLLCRHHWLSPGLGDWLNFCLDPSLLPRGQDLGWEFQPLTQWVPHLWSFPNITSLTQMHCGWKGLIMNNKRPLWFLSPRKFQGFLELCQKGMKTEYIFLIKSHHITLPFLKMYYFMHINCLYVCIYFCDNSS